MDNRKLCVAKRRRLRLAVLRWRLGKHLCTERYRKRKPRQQTVYFVAALDTGMDTGMDTGTGGGGESLGWQANKQRSKRECGIGEGNGTWGKNAQCVRETAGTYTTKLIRVWMCAEREKSESRARKEPEILPDAALGGMMDA